MRGSKAEMGTERVSANGYTYVKCEDSWRLKHHIVAEQKLKRPIRADERVVFVDGDKKNFKQNNIEVRPKGKAPLRRRKAVIEDKIRELKAELEEIEQELKS